MTISTYSTALHFLNSHIPRGPQMTFPGEHGLNRVRTFLSLLGSPQNKVKVIHIAGTSGKGSTATILSRLLRAAGFTVGLHVSPFFIDIRERMQINNVMIPKREFVCYLNAVMPAFHRVGKGRFGSPTYFEALTALAYYVFSEKRMDYAVVETGMGGWYDATNAADDPNKLCVITRIGLDHTSVLGTTEGEIAYQKGMIMHRGNRVIALFQKEEVNDTLIRVAEEQGAFLEFVKESREYGSVAPQKNATYFDFAHEGIKLKRLCLGLRGGYQAENASLALCACLFLAQRDGFHLSDELIRKTLKKVSYPGRFEVRSIRKRKLILDGAHNPQKMGAFISSLRKLYPTERFDFLISFKKGKDYRKMIDIIVPVAKRIIVTSFFYDKEDLVHLSEDPAVIVRMIKKTGFKNGKAVTSTKEALLKVLVADKKRTVVITGSLYLLASLYPTLTT